MTKEQVRDVEGSESTGSEQVSATTGQQSSGADKGETRVVNKLRTAVSLMMVFTGIAFGTCVYLKTRSNEREDFEEE